MKIEVGTRVKIVKCPYGEFNGRVGVVTEEVLGSAMVASKKGLPDHYFADGEFHLYFACGRFEPIDTLTIEPGKYYRTRDGRKVGPMHFDDYGGKWPWDQYGKSMLWDHDGKCDEGGNLDIIAEWAEDDDLNAICDERQDGPFVRDPELTSPYGYNNHPLPPLPPMTGTLAELNVKPGDVVECVEYGGDYWTPGLKYTISKSGEIPSNDGDLFHLDAPCEFKGRIISRASDTTKTWGEMTNAEKGELLLARHEGKVIENNASEGKWIAAYPVWSDNVAYRIKPQPQRETVTLCGSDIRLKPFIAGHRITFDTIEGKPDLGSIKMEELG